MQTYGPEAYLEKNPNYFDGLNKSSKQWPKLASAWNRYVEVFCSQTNDAKIIRQLYVEHLRAIVPTQKLAPVVKFLNSEDGKRWYPAEREATRRITADLAKMQIDINAVQFKIYEDEQTRIHEEFVAQKETSAKKP